jgi:hypothetical protein
VSMFPPRLIRATTVAAVAILATLFTGTAASARSVDTTPPSAPFIGYAEGFYCLTVIIGANRSTDNVTRQSALTYQAFADGVPIGALTDRGQPSGPWGVLQLKKAGPNTITVEATDAAGNHSARSNADVVTGYFTPGCTPYHF